ncbi:MAG: hypothetical protein WC792_04405 [Candidatus Micrarchaeia archaeon]|jgi:hypothetical protein
MNKDAEDAFNRLEAKLDSVSAKQRELSQKFDSFRDFEENIDKAIDSRLMDVRGVEYLTLALVIVLIALLFGALLKTMFG